MPSSRPLVSTHSLLVTHSRWWGHQNLPSDNANGMKYQVWRHVLYVVVSVTESEFDPPAGALGLEEPECSRASAPSEAVQPCVIAQVVTRICTCHPPRNRFGPGFQVFLKTLDIDRLPTSRGRHRGRLIAHCCQWRRTTCFHCFAWISESFLQVDSQLRCF